MPRLTGKKVGLYLFDTIRKWGIKWHQWVLFFYRNRVKLNSKMLTKRDREKFERLTMRYLDAAYNLALWIMKDPAEAEDVVQIAYMKAFENFLRFEGENAGGWILTITRNSAFNLLKKKKNSRNVIAFDEAAHSGDQVNKDNHNAFNFSPDEIISFTTMGTNLTNAIQKLPVEFREVLLLREIEGYSYKEIAEITEVATGTVMSRLSRARNGLRKIITEQKQQQEQSSEM